MQQTPVTIEEPIVERLFFNAKLHSQTVEFWKLSQSWNGVKNHEAITCQDALNTSNALLRELNPERPLALRVSFLKDKVIMYGSKKNMLKEKDVSANLNIKLPITVL